VALGAVVFENWHYLMNEVNLGQGDNWQENGAEKNIAR
jgi:hypothetical protein